MAAGIHISISAEQVARVAGLDVTNSMITSVIVSLILIFLSIFFYLTYRPSNKPTGFHNFVEMIVEMFFGLVQGVTQSETKTALFLPYIATFFLFICLNNWFGLLPGVGTVGFYKEAEVSHESATVTFPQVHAATTEKVHLDSTETTGTVIQPELSEVTSSETDSNNSEHKEFVPYLRAGTADLNMTLALAIISQFMAQGFGIYFLGFSYFKKFLNFSSPILFFVGILEFMGEFTKIVSYAFRLFGNIFAGEVLLVVITYLTKVVVPMPFYGLELFVGVIQALVFSMLSLVFFNMATMSHSEEH